jgi:hypothetical protein
MRLRGLVRTLVCILVFYVICEIGFRVYKYERLSAEFERNTRYSFSSFQRVIYKTDPEVGYDYLPNSHNRQWLYDKDGSPLPHNSHIVTNNMGMFSPDDVQVTKSPDEYRVAVLGDSFCATTTSDVVWPTVLQETLNVDAELKRAVKKSKFTVLNFGLDGTGLVQWPAVYRSRAAQFQPDLLIVNFISHDIIRKFVYRDTLKFGENDEAMFACASLPVDIRNPSCRNGFAFVIDAEREDPRRRSEEIKKQIYTALLRDLPWYSFYPELLAALTRGHLGLHRRLEVVVSRPGIFGLSNLFYDGEQEARNVSLDALKQIVAMGRPLLVLHHPVIEEVLAGQSSSRAQQFMAAARVIPIIDMVKELPKGASAEEVNKWYNLPYDSHPSSYGAKIYGESAEKQVRAILLAKQHGAQ